MSDTFHSVPGGDPRLINEDLAPVYGGLGVDGGTGDGNPGDDNIGPGEQLG